MGLAWTESHQELVAHPKTKRLRRLLGIRTPEAIGTLHMLWWWALDYAQDGNLTRFTVDDVADACEWDGSPQALFDALVDAGFIDISEGGVTLHDWDEYGGKYFKRREQSRVRQERYQRVDNAELPADNALLTRYPRVDNASRGEERTGEDRTGEETSANAPVAPAAPAPKSKRAAVIGAWEPTGDEREWAYAQGFSEREVNEQIPQFLDYYRGHGKPMKDWPATFRNWMRRSRSFAPSRASPSAPRPGSRGEDPHRFFALADRYAKQEQGP